MKVCDGITVLKMHAKRTQMMLNALKMHSTCRVSSFAEYLTC